MKLVLSKITLAAILGSQAQAYAKVNFPAAFSLFAPYNVYADNTTDYDPRQFKPASGQIYYCKPAAQGGNDSNDGLTWETAVATPFVAIQKPDCVRVMARAGRYPNAFWGDTAPQANFRSFECVDGYAEWLAGNLDDSSNFVADIDNPGAYKWTGGATGKTVYECLDENNLDRFLNWRRMTRVASAALCASTPNSVAVVSGDIWVRMFDDRAPDAALRINTQRRVYPGRSGVDQYFEGVIWHGASVIWGGTTQTTARVHCYNCRAGYHHTGQGNANFAAAQSVFAGYKSCDSYSPAYDCYSYRFNSGGIVVDSRGYNAPFAGSNNGFTAHDNASAIAINCDFYQTSGRVSAHVTSLAMAMVGCRTRDALGNGASDYNASTDMILINCVNTGTNSAFGADGAGTKILKNTTITKLAVSGPVVVDESLYDGPGILPVMPPDPTNSGTVTLTGFEVGAPIVVTTEQLLANSDNALFIIDVTATNAAVTSVKTIGPWTVTPTASGTVTLSYTVCGEMGRTIAQTATAVAN